MPHVDSSAIVRITYDDRTRTLFVTFVSGRTYAYDAVPRRVYEAFLAAPSKGEFFNGRIRDSYRTTLVLGR